jgi:hypothetical protein
MAEQNEAEQRLAGENAQPAPASGRKKPLPGAAPLEQAELARTLDFQRIKPGWNVFSSDGEQIGQVTEIGDVWFAVRHGSETPRTLYIPEDWIESVANNRVVLNQPSGPLLDMKLDSPAAAEVIAHQRRSGHGHEPQPGEPAYELAIEEVIEERLDEGGAPLPQPPKMPPGGEAPRLSVAPELPSATAGPAAGAIAAPVASPRVIAAGPGALLEPVTQASTVLYVDERLERRGDALYAVDITVDPLAVARNVRRGQPAPARDNPTTHMAPAPGTPPEALSHQVNAADRSYTVLERQTGFPVLTSEASFDPPDGPTRQPGAIPGREHLPHRTPYLRVGVPGAGREINITNTDLLKNRHPDGDPFGTQESVIGWPSRPDRRKVANRDLEERLTRPALEEPAAPPALEEPHEH